MPQVLTVFNNLARVLREYTEMEISKEMIMNMRSRSFFPLGKLHFTVKNGTDRDLKSKYFTN